MRPKVIVVVGPTASGKSALAVRLARNHNGEVISADSRQVYRGLDLGTGKITKKEMLGVPHHLLDVSNPKRVFSADDYKKLGGKALEDILARGKTPIICGGTGLYIDALLGIASWPEVPPDPILRAKLEEKSTAELFTLLRKSDPKRAETIDKQNRARLIRALEIVKALGKVPLPRKKNSPYNVLWIGLVPKKEKLQERIHDRLYARMKAGMLREVQNLHKQGLSWKRMETLGLEYRYLSRLARGLMSKADALAKLETEIARYAKRQMTWFKRNADIEWFDPNLQTAQRRIEKKVKVFLSH